MSALLERIQQAGIRLRAEGDRIIATPKALVTDELRTLMRTHKQDLLDALRPDYTAADLQEMDRLLHELAELEGWTTAELKEMLDQRRRMAPNRVLEALEALRKAGRAALAPWPEKPANRSKVVLCVIEGGKSTSGSKRADAPLEPEAA